MREGKAMKMHSKASGIFQVLIIKKIILNKYFDELNLFFEKQITTCCIYL